MRSAVVALVLLVPLTAGCVDSVFGGEEPDAAALALLEEMERFPEWRMETSHGTIRMILYTGWTPTTAGHIIQLTDRDFYDGTIMHRVVDDFVIQGGDPTETGEGGSGPFGTSDDIPLEIHDGLDFGTGAVGLARWTDDTGDSQYFITEKPAIHLSQPSGPTGAIFGAYSLWAQVFDGFDVVRDIADDPVDANDKPVTDVQVITVEVLDPPQDADLINLIPNVHSGVSTQGYDGVLEVPRLVVAGHPAVFRFTTDTQEGGCDVQQFALSGPSNMVSPDYWQENSVDGCTYETVLWFDEPGEHVLDLGVDEVAFNVLAWSDAYAPYTGTTKTGA